MKRPFFSIIIPVYNGGAAFLAGLQALLHSAYRNWELIVVDDGSTDVSATLAKEFGAQVVNTGGRRGPAAARNLGAQFAQGEYLLFLDADCEVNTHTLNHLAYILMANPQFAAVFGSYDDSPQAKNFIAQYKNLFHHYVHQKGRVNASTFWAGCGVIERSLFLKLGGFDAQRYPKPSVEDIELGYRIRQNGGIIHLAKEVQVKHHKAWRFGSLIKTDMCDRAIPWTRLLLNYPSRITNDLNLSLSSRFSVILTYSVVACCCLGYYATTFWSIALTLVALLILLNQRLYRFFYTKRGSVFMVRAIAMHWLYFLYSGISFGIGCLLHLRSPQSPKPCAMEAPVGLVGRSR
jgi:glycosyltransferase involved in cell wall biosynthesis